MQALDARTELPRFNMPFELELFIGCRDFSTEADQKSKEFLVLDAEPWRFRKSVSDLAGFDIESHDSSAEKIIKLVRDWLANALNKKLYGAVKIQTEFLDFERLLPNIASDLASTTDQIGYTDLCHMIKKWIAESSGA